MPDNPSNKKNASKAIPRGTFVQLDARRIEFITTAVICVIFAICFAHLEYYYI